MTGGQSDRWRGRQMDRQTGDRRANDRQPGEYRQADRWTGRLATGGQFSKQQTGIQRHRHTRARQAGDRQAGDRQAGGQVHGCG